MVNWDGVVGVAEIAIAVTGVVVPVTGVTWWALNHYVKRRIRDHDQDAAIERLNQEIGKLTERIARTSGGMDVAFTKIRELQAKVPE
jgi:hypothetical protein